MNARIRSALWGALSDIADDVCVGRPGKKEDVYRAQIRVGRSIHVADVAWAAEGWPEDISRVLGGRASVHQPESLVIAARSLSPGSLERVAQLGLNWVDETGAARIVLPSGLAVYRERSQALRPPLAAFAWTPAAIAVGEALLTIQDASVRMLQSATGVSLGRISKVLQAFDREGFTRKGPAENQAHTRRALADRESLLRSWAPAAGSQRRSRWMLTRAERDPLKFFEQTVAPHLGPAGTWALTGPAGAQLEAPYVALVPTVHVYVDSSFPERLQTLRRSAGLIPVEQGARFEFWLASPVTLRLSRPVRSQIESELYIADLPRVYADLLALGGRHAESAGHMREMTNLGW